MDLAVRLCRQICPRVCLFKNHSSPRANIFLSFSSIQLKDSDTTVGTPRNIATSFAVPSHPGKTPSGWTPTLDLQILHDQGEGRSSCQQATEKSVNFCSSNFLPQKFYLCLGISTLTSAVAAICSQSLITYSNHSALCRK